jgi:hypothetical protein
VNPTIRAGNFSMPACSEIRILRIEILSCTCQGRRLITESTE